MKSKVSYPYANKVNSVGIPLLKITISAFDPDTGEELKCGQEGEICIHSPSTMLGYVNNQKETDNIIQTHKDGFKWVHSGDLGYVDEDGFIYISGRLKRYFLHINDGIQKKIFSLDVEKVLVKHPYIDNCTVVPVSNSTTFQVPVAYVVLKKEYRSSSKFEAEFIKYAEENLTGGYRPVKFFFVDSFPLTKIGKVDYRALEALAEKE